MGSVARDGITVLLSSHLLGDLERVCDYLIVLQSARVQVLGEVEALLAEHKLLVGPHRKPADIAAVAVVQESHTEKQSSLLVRLDQRAERNELGRLRHDPQWTVRDVTLEDLVLAYLATPSAGALPGPARSDLGVSA